jgi:hypothetical protein
MGRTWRWKHRVQHLSSRPTWGCRALVMVRIFQGSWIKVPVF